MTLNLEEVDEAVLRGLVPEHPLQRLGLRLSQQPRAVPQLLVHTQLRLEQQVDKDLSKTSQNPSKGHLEDIPKIFQR